MASFNFSFSSISTFPRTTKNHINSTAATTAATAASASAATASAATASAATAATIQPNPEAPLSLFDITRRNNREELYINPVRWTGRHTELLNFFFHGPYPEPKTAASVERAQYSEHRSGTRHLKDFFNFYYKSVMREQGIWQLITTDSCPLMIYEPTLTLSLGDSVVKDLRCMAFYLRDSVTGRRVHKLPVAALVDQSRITKLRKDYLGMSRCQQWVYWNRPMCRVYQKKWMALIPPNPMHDPFIAALLIGLAQKKRRYLRDIGSPEEEKAGKLHSQVVHTYNCRPACGKKGQESYHGWLFLYQADIPSTLLDMFEQPNVAPPETPRVDVHITKVPYLPLATLRARLLEVLLPGTAASTAAAGAAASDSAVWQALARKVAADAMSSQQGAQCTQGMTQGTQGMAQNATQGMAQNMPQGMAQGTMTAAPGTPSITVTPPPAPMVQPVNLAYANQHAGQKRKYANGHHDQPYQRSVPSPYLAPGNQN
ncbi:hypothetical protein ACQKWADRAFT_206605 [Trichoderma austrokoningii]